MSAEGGRLPVAISLLALLLAVATTVAGSPDSSATFVVESTAPGNQIVTLDPQGPATYSVPVSRPAGAVDLAWTASTTAALRTETTYSVHRSNTSGGTYTQLAGGLTGLTYTDTPGSDGTYYYKVRTDISSFSAESLVRAGLSDRTAPVSSLTCNGSACSSVNWYTAAISVVLSATDGGSGVATVTRTVDGGASTPGSSPASFTVSGDNATHSVAHNATDVAGNVSGSTTQTLKLDGTVPTISGAATPAANSAGWRNTNVTVTFTCADALSGLASCTAPVTLSSDGASQSSSGTAVDVAGNSAEVTVSGIKIDKTPPTAASGLTSASGQPLGATTVELSWAAATDTTSLVSGYTLHWVSALVICPAASATNYPNTIPLGAVTSYTFTEAAATYCFYLVTKDLADNASVNSTVTGPTLAH